MNTDSTIIDALKDSDIYHEYQHAYTQATGLPIALRRPDQWHSSFEGKAAENSFCALMAGKNATCAACLRMQERLAAAAADGPAIMKCQFGLTEAAVPVKLGNETLGFLTTGQVFTQKPSEEQFRKVARSIARMGIKLDRKSARKAYMGTRVMPRTQFVSATGLLSIFADHLAMKSNHIAVHNANAEPTAVVRAKAYIREHLHEHLTLTNVAAAAHTSTFYICKLFKRHTGLNFTEYVSRLRIERASDLLANPNKRVSEIAYEVGFQSLTHFNRIFRRIVGESPTTHRNKVSLPLAA